MSNIWVSIGSVLLACAVGAGAFGAHGLREHLDAYSMSVYEKAVFYHFVHSLGILIVATLTTTNVLAQSSASRVQVLLLVGTLVFSGSLYILAVSGIRWLGAITPIGGVCFVFAWMLLAWESFRGAP